jgi:hypothetical protein
MGADAVAAAVSERFPEAATAAQAGSAPESSGAEFVIFSKPELGRLSSSDLAAVWDLFASSFAAYDLTVHRIKIMTGPELDQAGLMQQHYGVINQISRLGRPALTEAAEKSLSGLLADAPEDTEVLGGHQFLERYPEISPFALAMLFSNAKVSRLGPGTYAAPVRIDGATVIILNGFHPRQLSFFTADDAACAFLHASSPTDWEVLRSELIGATDPSQATDRSIRGTLYADPATFGLTSVNSNFNGVHMSAGPLEGLGELDRFFGEVQQLTDWSFARTLAAAGASTDVITEYLENPVIQTDGERGTAFDLTEGVNPEPAAKLLVGAQRLS